MKWFLSICALAGVVAILSSSSCGPKRDFCPTAPEFSCLDYDAGAGGAGGQDLGFCDGGTVYICGNGTKQCTPCS